MPATKACPKEMLPIVDKPLIQYAVEEAAEAGISDLIFITGSSKRAIEDHFDRAGELESVLLRDQKIEWLDCIKNIPPKGVNCIFIRQAQALGLGHAIFCAKPAVGNEPFAVLLADDLMVREYSKGVMGQMVEEYQGCGGSMVAVEEVSLEETEKYGIVSGSKLTDKIGILSNIIEKPKKEAAPSNTAVVGRYILSAKIFEYLERAVKGSGGEIQLTDAIAELISVDKVFSYKFDGMRFDCGSKAGYLKATVMLGLSHSIEGKTFRDWLSNLKF